MFDQKGKEDRKIKAKKLAVILSQITAKYHLQTAITPFAIIIYFNRTPPSIAISWYFIYVKIRRCQLINGDQVILNGITHQFCNIIELQLFHQVGPVRVDGTRADI